MKMKVGSKILAMVPILAILMLVGTALAAMYPPLATLKPASGEAFQVRIQEENNLYFQVLNKNIDLLDAERLVYAPGDTMATGMVELRNKGTEPYALALWGEPIWSEEGPFVAISSIEVAKLEKGGYGPFYPLSSPNELIIIAPGEQYNVRFEVRVDPFSVEGDMEEVVIRLNHLPVCEVDGKIEPCEKG